MKNFDMIVIGGGPAGLSAALYGGRAGLKVALFTGPNPGGLLTTTETVENYLGLPQEGFAMAENFLNHAQSFGATVFYEAVTSWEKSPEGFLVTGESREVQGRSLVVATGATPRKLGVPGEDLSGVSWCATCDGAFFKGEHVALVGGGEAALEDALYLSRLVRKVTLILRGDKFRVTGPALDKLLAQPNVEVLKNRRITSILGENGVTGVELSDGTTLEVTGVFEAIGQEPVNHLVGEATLSPEGFVRENHQPGVFIAGDLNNQDHRQVAVAVGDGAKAAMEAIRWLQL